MDQSTTSPGASAGRIETFRAVPGWPFEINESGTVVRPISSATASTAKPRPFSIGARQHGCAGYYYVTLRDGPRRFRTTVHALVALAFLGPRPYKMVIHHKDRNRFNNHHTNLAYVSQRENLDLDGRRGQYPPGERHPHAKLRDGDVRAIKACLAAGKDNADIARFFNVDAGTVDKIWRGERWPG